MTITMDELKKSSLYRDIVATADRISAALDCKNELKARTNLFRWEGHQIALKFITGKDYAWTRTDDYYGIVNEDDESDWLYYRDKRMEGVTQCP